jgi:gas vesicle protein GvpA/GvpJ/GvpM family
VTSDGVPRPQISGSRNPNYLPTHRQSDSLADVLERVLDKGIVIAGDIQIRLLDIELLTIKLRLLVASVDKAREMGINWWESDDYITQLEDDVEKDQLSDLNRRLEALEGRSAESPGVESTRGGREGAKRGQR